LRQAEELAMAAKAAGYAARPLPLFYSLSQAGRAIAAVHLPDPWILRGHGLTVPPASPTPSIDSSTAQKLILDTIVKMAKEKDGEPDSFRGVAKAIESPTLKGGVTLGALWSANPDLSEVPVPPSLRQYPRALTIPIGVQSISTVPGEPIRDPEMEKISTGGLMTQFLRLRGATGEAILESLKIYPSLQGAFGLKQGPNGLVRAGLGDLVERDVDSQGVSVARVAKAVPKFVSHIDWWRTQREFASFVESDPTQPRYPGPQLIGHVLPDLAGGPSPHPLMLWWALLLGLSSLARYEPAAWTSAINLDGSTLAVSLERVLDIAEDRVPQRVLESLVPRAS
jgi:hypothetical protein